MQSTAVSPSWLQSSLQKMLLIPFTFCISRQKTGLPGAVAVASLHASRHIWSSSAFQQTQDSWEGATHHHLIFGDVSSRQALLLGTMPGLSAPASRSDKPGPVWAELHLAPLAAGSATEDHTSQRPCLADYSAVRP